MTVESPLAPTAVLDNLRIRGRAWRAAAVPEDLKKFKIHGMSVDIDDTEFTMHWLGNISPFYNPVCFGQIEPLGNGSRIRAGFTISQRTVVMIVLYAIAAILPVLNVRSALTWSLFGFMMITLSIWVLHNRADEPMRTRLIEVLRYAANPPAGRALSAANTSPRLSS